MKKILLTLAVLTLSGCSLMQPTEDQATDSNLSWEQQQTKLQQLDNWTLTGKLAIFTEDDRQSANLYWQQKSNNYDIQLSTFIGTRVLQVNKDGPQVKIINSDDQTFVGEDANTLIQQIVPGLDLPIASLQQWIKANPMDASYQLNDQQQVSELLGYDESGHSWEVKYQNYQAYSGYYLPKNIELKRDSIRLKIAVSQWNITP
ncbi:lipoprotein insertase outer membrane protein LolB [Psychromonas aquatilis]|uniref:Outer-membrane lipoprotein LolB n=1 Tax=Psychromonas aquatilis TaxID=2005072 RepID=A0ABU9GP05_9GAMM